MKLNDILTETRNARTMNIDQISTNDMLAKINEEDKEVALAVEKVIPTIALMVDKIVLSFQNGGRLIYVGAGTSGRLGILDASECPPTYGTSPEMVIGIIAGGEKAIRSAIEGAEDDEAEAIRDIQNLNITVDDCLIGIAASGRTPYTISAMSYAKEKGATVGAIVCSPGSKMEDVAHIPMVVETGPEVITGSTRMKAGTAQKLVLNMLTTASMIKIGKVYGNLMVDVQPTNEKLRERAKAIVSDATGATMMEAANAIEQHGAAKPAILSILSGFSGLPVIQALEKHNGHLKEALKELLENKDA